MSRSGKPNQKWPESAHKDLAAALKRLQPRQYGERFPKAASADSGDTPTQLFERWAKECEAAAGTIESWQYVFREMEQHFEKRCLHQRSRGCSGGLKE